MIIILYITLDCGPTHYRVTIQGIRHLEDVSEFSVHIGTRLYDQLNVSYNASPTAVNDRWSRNQQYIPSCIAYIHRPPYIGSSREGEEDFGPVSLL